MKMRWRGERRRVVMKRSRFRATKRRWRRSDGVKARRKRRLRKKG